MELDEAGVIFVLSNSYAQPVQQLFQEIEAFRVDTVQATRVISSKAKTRGYVNEILVTNIPPHISSQIKLNLKVFLEENDKQASE